MSIAGAAAGAVVGVLVLWLAIVLVRYNRKRLHIVRKGEAASAEQLETIYRLIEGCGEKPSAGWVLARTNAAAPDGRALIVVPGGLERFPWSGRVVEIDVGRKEAPFAFVAGTPAVSQAGGKVFRAVRIPRVAGKNGRSRNVYSPRRYLVMASGLRAVLRQVCPEHPEDVLGYLLCVSGATFEFEPIDQARIGASPAWVQDPEWPACDRCRNRMVLILQLPDGMLTTRGGNCVLYWFGCRKHPESTRMVGQCS